MKPKHLSHVAVGLAAAVLASAATVLLLASGPAAAVSSTFGGVEGEAPLPGESHQTMLFETTMDDVLGRVVSIRRFDRGPGASSEPHRHPGSHTFGYVLEGTYEIQINDAPLQRLGPGETFYERPGELHAVSRNGSDTEPVSYLVIQVSDPALPGTVPAE